MLNNTLNTLAMMSRNRNVEYEIDNLMKKVQKNTIYETSLKNNINFLLFEFSIFFFAKIEKSQGYSDRIL